VLFAEDFDAPPPAPTVPALPPAVVPEPPVDIEAVCREAFARGRAEGLAAAMAQIDTAAAADVETLQRLLARVADAMNAAQLEAGRVAEAAAEAVARLLLATLAAMLPALCARHGPAEVVAVARAVLPSLAHAPQVAIRVAPEAVAALAAELTKLDPDLQARIAVTPLDAVAAGDVRIAWQDGCATRDTARLWQSIGETLAPIGLLDITAPCDANQ
jgi:flagellar biosynthesis/type III secretory pathway protein FliH